MVVVLGWMNKTSYYCTTKICQYWQKLVIAQWKSKETRSLMNINDSFKKIIVVKDHIMPRRNEEGIVTIGLLDFLLNEDSLNI